MDEARRPDEGKVEPDLKRPDKAIEDLEPDTHEGDEVKGGDGGITYDLKAQKVV